MTSALLARFEELARQAPEALAVIDEEGSHTFESLLERSRRVASSLRRRGLAEQRVALLAHGSAWVTGFFGILAADATVVPLSPLHPEAEHQYFVSASRSRAWLVGAELVARARAFEAALPVLVVPELVGEGDAAVTPRRTDADEAWILYTSGTTGKPKGAVWSHGSVARLAELMGRAWSWQPQDRLLHVLPLHHLHGIGIALLTSLLGGGTTRMLRAFEATRVWEELAQCNVFMGVPTMHKKLFDAFDAASAAERERWAAAARGLRLVTSGSAALPVSVGERWRALTGVYPLERFGMTEIGVGLANPLGGERRPGSCGQVLPGMNVRIVGGDGQDVRDGESGEIWIQGPTLFEGYDADPAATRAAFHDGWFKSGDTAVWLPDGYVKILGRTSVDILKSGGYKLSALEIEETLREHPGVADAAVVGIPDETWGERVVAAVCPRADASLDGGALREWLKTRLAPYKVPKQVVVWAELPRNALGKVVKGQVSAALREADGAS